MRRLLSRALPRVLGEKAQEDEEVPKTRRSRTSIFRCSSAAHNHLISYQFMAVCEGCSNSSCSSILFTHTHMQEVGSRTSTGMPPWHLLRRAKASRMCLTSPGSATRMFACSTVPLTSERRSTAGERPHMPTRPSPASAVIVRFADGGVFHGEDSSSAFLERS